MSDATEYHADLMRRASGRIRELRTLAEAYAERADRAEKQLDEAAAMIRALNTVTTTSMRAQLDAVRALHKPVHEPRKEYAGLCSECGVRYPCPTAKAAGAAT